MKPRRRQFELHLSLRISRSAWRSIIKSPTSKGGGPPGRYMCEDLQNASGATCLHCGYKLRELTSIRCPECGTEFDTEFLAIPKNSWLYWERKYKGGLLRRIIGTFLYAWIHPIGYFKRAATRKNKCIQCAGQLLILACVVTLMLDFASILLLTFVSSRVFTSNLPTAANTTGLELRAIVIDFIDTALIIASTFISILFISLALRFGLTKKLYRFGTIDYCALLCPGITFVHLLAIITLLIQFFAPLFFTFDRRYFGSQILNSLDYVGPIYLGVLTCICARHVLDARIRQCIGIGILAFVVDWAVTEIFLFTVRSAL